MVLNHDFADLGGELVTNGDFNISGALAGNSYTLGWRSGDGGLTIANGVLNLHNNGSGFVGRAYATNGINSYSNVLITGKTYKISYEVTENIANSTLYAYLGAFIAVDKTVGIHTTYITATTHFFLFRNGSSDTTIKIDNVSIKQVDPNDRWTKSAEWSISEGKATCSGGASKTLYQSNILPLGTLYEIKFTVSSYTSGYLSAFSGDWDALGVIDSVGTFVRRSVSLGTNTGLVGNSFIGTVDNITVKEYAAMPLDV